MFCYAHALMDVVLFSSFVYSSHLGREEPTPCFEHLAFFGKCFLCYLYHKVFRSNRIKHVYFFSVTYLKIKILCQFGIKTSSFLILAMQLCTYQFPCPCDIQKLLGTYCMIISQIHISITNLVHFVNSVPLGNLLWALGQLFCWFSLIFTNSGKQLCEFVKQKILSWLINLFTINLLCVEFWF